MKWVFIAIGALIAWRVLGGLQLFQGQYSSTVVGSGAPAYSLPYYAGTLPRGGGWRRGVYSTPYQNVRNPR